ncbi:MAG: gamma-glutamyltransferase [Hyphomicrobiaceae bacterium]
MRPEVGQRGTPFVCEKRPAIGDRGMIVTNNPHASAAGAEILLAGGNAIDAAVSALFALTVVEPMMVGVLGGGISHLRLANGRHVVVDGLSTAPRAARPDMFVPVSDGAASARDTEGRFNAHGATSVATPGSLAGWVHMLERYGTRPLHVVLKPAIRLAEDGFLASPYLCECVSAKAADLAADAGLASRFLPGGRAITPGARIVQPDYARTLREIAEKGGTHLYGGMLGQRVAAHLGAAGGTLSTADLSAYRPLEREVITSQYRGVTVVGPPPPAASGVHIAQMLNILEGFDVASLGFGTPDGIHLLAEALKIAFADRAVATADPAFVDVPVARLISRSYAQERSAALDMGRTQRWQPGRLGGYESDETTHLTVADGDGNVVAATQTINGLFGACVEIPGTGMIANNYMHNFDPHPGRALSIAPGKRVFTSMAPMMLVVEGRVRHALGLPGALRIFPSAFQAIVNLIDHRMSTQEAVEAPRIWTEGLVLELEPAFSAETAAALAARGHEISRVNLIGGGMNAVSIADDNTMTGSACWRADGTPVAIAGGLARRGIRFSTN